MEAKRKIKIKVQNEYPKDEAKSVGHILRTQTQCIHKSLNSDFKNHVTQSGGSS